MDFKNNGYVKNPYTSTVPYRSMHSVHPGGLQSTEVAAIISEIVEKIKKEYNPPKIILFGSYAYGTPTKGSDIYLFIVKDADERRMKNLADMCISRFSL
jgi:hypothetical protein